MMNAVNDVQSNLLSIKMAAFKYKINRTTLMNHLKGNNSGKVGRPTILTLNEETVIVHAIQKLGDWGFGIDRRVVQDIVQDFIIRVDRKTPFKDGKPGRDWMYSFENRWKTVLTRRVSQPLPANRAYACNDHILSDFYDKLEAVLDRLQLHDKPQNIFNVDETGFQTDVGVRKILCKRGLRNPHKNVASSTKTMYTVQICCSAVGNFMTPYIVFKGLHLYNTWCEGGPEGTKYNCSKSGWMEADQFLEWFDKVFVQQTAQLEGGKLLIFDGHNSHLSKAVVDLAVTNNIELLCLPAHTSSVLQPLDVGVFKTVKAKWRTCLSTYYDETRYRNVDKPAFPPLLKLISDAGAFSRANAISSFEACGIYPLNRHRIPADKIATAQALITGEDMSNNNAAAATNAADDEELMMQMDIEQNVAVADVSLTVTPRKRIEEAILNHLRQVTPKENIDGRKRIKRTFAECLTSAECIARLEESKNSKKTTGKKNCKLQLKSNVVCQPSLSVPQPSSSVPQPSDNRCLIAGDETYDSSDDDNFPMNIENLSLLDDDSDDSMQDSDRDEISTKLKVGQYVGVKYDDKWYVALIEKRFENDELDVKCMKNKGMNKFVWPDKDDVLMCPISDILCVVSEPIKVNDRYMSLSKEDYDAVDAAFNR